MPDTYDVIVVGGGPAGSTAARRAALEGARVLLLDAARFPRPKPCGGAVSAQAMSYLDFPLDQALVQAEVFGARVHYRDSVVEARRAERIAVLTSRADLDHHLLARAAEAGARVLEATRVVAVESGPDRALAHTASATYRARYIVGADGAQSVVARAVRPPLPREQYAVAYELDLPGHHPGGPEDLIDIFLGSFYMGYAWAFPKRGHWNVGVGEVASTRRNVKRAAHDFLKVLPGAGSPAPTHGAGWTIPVGGNRHPVGRGRLLLAGDAAGFVDPLYGEGIAGAILSGSGAGQILGAAGPRGPEPVQALYGAFCSRSIEGNLRHALLLARLLHSFPGTLLRLFSTSPRFLARYLEIPAGWLTYRDYLLWFLPRALLQLGTLPFRRPASSGRAGSGQAEAG